LLNQEVNPDIFDLDAFKSIRPQLDNINNIHCLETQLYSDHLQVAGTVDCIAEYKGRLSIIDFKTASREKQRDDIHSYFMQTSAYAVMFEERTGIPIDRLVILIAVDDKPDCSVFVERRDDWIGEFLELREVYSKLKGH
jgi:genome maintenance exonuclease 1